MTKQRTPRFDVARQDGFTVCLDDDEGGAHCFRIGKTLGAFIVEACNAHDALVARVAELEAVLRHVDQASLDCLLGPTALASHDQAVAVNAALFAARAALAKVQS